MAKKAPSSKVSAKAADACQRAAWKCPRCGRAFTQVNQRHACGTGDSRVVLRDRPQALARIYASIETFAKTLGPVEIVARERYVLLRSVRIFADLVIMTDAVRIAVHLRRKVADPLFFKVVSDAKKVTHVAKLKTAADVTAIKPYLKEAYAASLE
jgi:DNA-directed RNA polymerase subunit RPC12/RpoP